MKLIFFVLAIIFSGFKLFSIPGRVSGIDGKSYYLLSSKKSHNGWFIKTPASFKNIIFFRDSLKQRIDSKNLNYYFPGLFYYDPEAHLYAYCLKQVDLRKYSMGKALIKYLICLSDILELYVGYCRPEDNKITRPIDQIFYNGLSFSDIFKNDDLFLKDEKDLLLFKFFEKKNKIMKNLEINKLSVSKFIINEMFSLHDIFDSFVILIADLIKRQEKPDLFISLNIIIQADLQESLPLQE